MASVAVTGRFDLTDAQWAVLEPLLPVGKKPGRPSRWTRRQLIDGIRWRIRAGTPWRDVPAVYGSWQAVYGLFRRWQRAGIWAANLAPVAGACTIPEKTDQIRNRKNKGRAGGRPPAFDPEIYKQRHAVECGINRLKRNRAVGTSSGRNSRSCRHPRSTGASPDRLLPDESCGDAALSPLRSRLGDRQEDLAATLVA